MAPELAKRLIREIAENNLSPWITFHIMGEPYLHKNLVELCQYAEDWGVHVRLLTNGSYLNAEINRRIFATGVSRLEVGFRTPNNDSFNLRRRSGRLNLESYIAQSKGLLKDTLTIQPRTRVVFKFFLRSKASYLPFVNPYRHLTNREDNVAVMDDLYQHCLAAGKKLGLDMRRFRGLKVRPQRNELEVAPQIFFSASRIQDFWMRENTEEGTDGYVKARIGGCQTFREDFGIFANGDVTTCCVDYDAKNVVGNVRNSTLLEVLDSAEVKRIRQSFARYIPPCEYCKKCLGGPNVMYSVTKQIASAAQDFLARSVGSRLHW
jgi:radical SAM protein with 4Fe4S-binding SPASM domain